VDGEFEQEAAMVAKELLEELKNTSSNFDWTYDGRKRKIRATLKSDPDGLVFDPIGAACYSRTGLVFDQENWYRAAEELGLSHIDAGDLTAAANNVAKPYLRQHLINDLMLPPETDPMGFEIPEGIVGYLSSLSGKGHSHGIPSARRGG
jgi:hypothetical protein